MEISESWKSVKLFAKKSQVKSIWLNLLKICHWIETNVSYLHRSIKNKYILKSFLNYKNTIDENLIVIGSVVFE